MCLNRTKSSLKAITVGMVDLGGTADGQKGEEYAHFVGKLFGIIGSISLYSVYMFIKLIIKGNVPVSMWISFPACVLYVIYPSLLVNRAWRGTKFNTIYMYM